MNYRSATTVESTASFHVIVAAGFQPQLAVILITPRKWHMPLHQLADALVEIMQNTIFLANDKLSFCVCGEKTEFQG